MTRSFSSIEGDTLSVGQLVNVVWRNIFWVIAVVFIALGIGIYQAYVAATPIYRAVSVVMMNDNEQQVVDLGNVMTGQAPTNAAVLTQVEVLKSRSLLGKVVDELGLAENPEFNTMLQPPSIREKISEQLRKLVDSIFPQETTAVSQIEGTEGMRLDPARRSAIDSLSRTVTVSNVNDTFVFQIFAESESPEMASRISDTIAQAYIDMQIANKTDATRQGTDWLATRVGELQTELEDAETRVKTFRASINLINPETLETLELQLKDIRARIDDTQAALSLAQNRLTIMEQADSVESKAAAVSDTRLTQYLPQISEPQVQQDFDTLWSEILQRTRIEVDRHLNQLALLESAKTDFEVQIKEQSDDLIRLQQLNREADASRQLYEYFLQRLKEMSAQEGIQQADSRILSLSVVPTSPAKPRKSTILSLSLLLGVMAGTALVLFKDLRKNTYVDPKDMEKTLGYNVLGKIPMIIRSRRNRGDVIKYLKAKPTSRSAEAIRNLRTSLLLSDIDNPPQIMMLTSSLPGEGKTTLSIALAQNMADIGKKVLLIEGDIRRRVFTKYFTEKTSADKGLVSLVTGGSTLEESVDHSDILGCDILQADQTQLNAADLLQSEKFTATLEMLREHYDQIIIDTPPVLVVPDARIIAPLVDGIFFVVRFDTVSKPLVNSAIQELEQIGFPPKGLVLNQITQKTGRGYGNYGYSYGYGSYASKYYTN